MKLSIQEEESIEEALTENLESSKLDDFPAIINEQESWIQNCIKFISIGQYRTPLPYKEKEFYSSTMGGILTIIFVLSFIAYGVVLFISIFSFTNWDLYIYTEQFSTLTSNSYQDKIDKNSKVCIESPTGECVDFTLKMFIDAYSQSQPSYCISFLPGKWPLDSSLQCKNLSIDIQFNHMDQGWLSILNITNLKIEEKFQQCCSDFDFTTISQNLKQMGISTQEIGLYTLNNFTNDRDYESRFRIKFYVVKEVFEVQSHFKNNIRVSNGGQTKMLFYSPNFSKKGVVHQQFLYVNFFDSRNLLGIGQYSNINTLQFLSQYQNLNFLSNSDEITLYFNIQPDKNNFNHYPQSFMAGLAKLGGLLAILKIGMLIQYYHNYLFRKEIQNESGTNENYKQLYSIENFKMLMDKVNILEREMEQVKKDGVCKEKSS